MKNRKPAVAGLFYPAQPDVLEDTVKSMLPVGLDIPQLKALIVPHAGYVYSGVTAGIAYSYLSDYKEQIHRVVLVGPSHRVAFEGIAASCADSFSMPLGSVPLDTDAIKQLLDQQSIICLDEAHKSEHSLEVQLPFLWMLLDQFKLIPLVCGHASSQAVADVLAQFADDPETLIIISSDLSHFHDYETARRMDAATAYAIEHLEPQKISSSQACGQTPVKAVLELAKEKKLRVKRLDLRNSGDTAGTKDSVVGYGAWAIHG